MNSNNDMFVWFLVVYLSMIPIITILTCMYAILQYYVKNFPLNEAVKIRVNREKLNQHYKGLSEGLRYILESNISSGYIVRREGNVLVFYKQNPKGNAETDNTYYSLYENNSNEIVLVDKPNKYKWYFVLKSMLIFKK